VAFGLSRPFSLRSEVCLLDGLMSRERFGYNGYDRKKELRKELRKKELRWSATLASDS
jgi:hypothetical protein